MRATVSGSIMKFCPFFAPKGNTEKLCEMLFFLGGLGNICGVADGGGPGVRQTKRPISTALGGGNTGVRFVKQTALDSSFRWP